MGVEDVILNIRHLLALYKSWTSNKGDRNFHLTQITVFPYWILSSSMLINCDLKYVEKNQHFYPTKVFKRNNRCFDSELKSFTSFCRLCLIRKFQANLNVTELGHCLDPKHTMTWQDKCNKDVYLRFQDSLLPMTELQHFRVLYISSAQSSLRHSLLEITNS